MSTLPGETSPVETGSELSDVEIIEDGPFVGGTETTSSSEPISRGSSLGTTAVAASAVFLLVAAFIFISRPGVEEQVENNERAQTTVPTTAASPATTVEPSIAITRRPLPDLPPFDGSLPEDLPGVIRAFDIRGAFLEVDRSQPAPVEELLEIPPASSTEADTTVFVTGAPPIGFDVDQLALGQNVDGAPSGVLDIRRLVGGEVGGVLLLSNTDAPQTARYYPLGNIDELEPPEWQLDTAGTEVLGLWEGELLVERAGEVWLLNVDGSTRSVSGDGQVLSFDGRHLARLVCSASASTCELVVGTPGAPDTWRLQLPEELERLSLEDWASSVAVSPEGGRVALSVRNGGLSLPTVVDLATGEFLQLGDGMNHRSPVAWSPDGEWVGYVFTDDVMVWRLEAGRSWRITLDRRLQNLLWG